MSDNTEVENKIMKIEKTIKDVINSYIEKDPERKTIYTRIPEDTILTTSKVREHEFSVDETAKYGGGDLAPDPYDYIVAGLAACTGITIRQYAKLHNIPLEDIEISTQYRRIETEGNEADKNQMVKYIRLHGNLTQEQIDELLEISESPAHKMLEDGVQILSFIDKE